MKTLISSTDTFATYKFTHDDSIRVVNYEKPANNDGQTGKEPFNHDKLAEAEYQAWLLWLGVSVD